MNVLTIGFTKKSAEEFFESLRAAHITQLVDVRLNNVSQLAGFSKKQDLAYFLEKICGIDYIHEPMLAPTQEILDEQRAGGSWAVYESKFLRLMESRKIEDRVPRTIINNGCLLCSEEKPHHCHRRLVAEYLKANWGELEIQHLP